METPPSGRRESATISATNSQIAETIKRLSSKPGVIATLAIDRISSTVLQSSGTFLTFRASDPAAFTTTNSIPAATAPTTTAGASPIPSDTAPEKGLEEMASMICTFVNSTGNLVQHFDSEDDVKLLRLRTKKHEFVIVPDAKFIFVVVHDTSS